MNWVLLVAVFLPLLSGIALGVIPGLTRTATRWVALGSTVATFVLVTILCFAFDPTRAAAPQFVFDMPLLPGAGSVRLALGLDGISLWLMPLTALLCIVAVLSSWVGIQEGVRGFHALLLVLETGLLGVFAALDVVLFYIFFEFTLIPLFFIIGLWGGEERRLAAIKFFLYTLAGSVLTLIGLVYTLVAYYNQHGTWSFSIPDLIAGAHIPPEHQMLVFLALFAGFAIKVPLFPFHTWLPLAHVEAPTAGSVLLAGVLLKLGAYGFVRFSLPLTPVAASTALPWIGTLAVAGIVYGALCAMAQRDIKRLVAYSSISHMGFCVLGLFALNEQGIAGGILQMVNHGLATGAMFAIVGMLYDRYHTRMIEHYGGTATVLPRLVVLAMIIIFAGIGLPGLNGFVGEILVLFGAFRASKLAGALAAIGIVLGAYYMLTLAQRAFFGEKRTGEAPDLRWYEAAALIPVAVACFWIGLWPGLFLKPMEPAIAYTLDLVNSGLAAQSERTGPDQAGLRGFDMPDTTPAVARIAQAGIEPSREKETR